MTGLALRQLGELGHDDLRGVLPCDADGGVAIHVGRDVVVLVGQDLLGAEQVGLELVDRCEEEAFAMGPAVRPIPRAGIADVEGHDALLGG